MNQYVTASAVWTNQETEDWCMLKKKRSRWLRSHGWNPLDRTLILVRCEKKTWWMGPNVIPKKAELNKNQSAGKYFTDSKTSKHKSKYHPCHVDHISGTDWRFHLPPFYTHKHLQWCYCRGHSGRSWEQNCAIAFGHRNSPGKRYRICTKRSLRLSAAWVHLDTVRNLSPWKARAAEAAKNRSKDQSAHSSCWSRAICPSQHRDQLSGGGGEDDDDADSNLRRRRRLSSAAFGSPPSTSDASSSNSSSMFSLLSVSEAAEVESAAWEETVAPFTWSTEEGNIYNQGFQCLLLPS